MLTKTKASQLGFDFEVRPYSGGTVRVENMSFILSYIHFTIMTEMNM